VVQAADARLVIPMRAGMRSLNVAMTVAMAAGEMLRQRQPVPWRLMQGRVPAPTAPST
jgi:tRNA(Leu) C34 or U34 (ribose-2'-O)-methylase TrmL